jgi:hypothetical protein
MTIGMVNATAPRARVCNFLLEKDLNTEQEAVDTLRDTEPFVCHPIGGYKINYVTHGTKGTAVSVVATAGRSRAG